MSYDAEVADESERRKRAVRAMLPIGGDPIGDTTAMTGQDSHALAYSPAHIAGMPDPTPPMPPSEGDVDALSNDRLMNEGSISPSMTVTRPYHADDGAFAGVPLPPISPDWIPKDAKPGEDPLPPPPPPPPPDKDKDAGPSAVLAFGRAAGPRGSAGDDASPVSRYMSTTKRDDPAPAESEGVDLGSALGGPVERFLQSFRSTATNGRYQPNFTEANRLDAQMNEPMKRAEAARKAREDATKAMAERTAANARAAASLAETNRHNLATEGKTTPEKVPAVSDEISFKEYSELSPEKQAAYDRMHGHSAKVEGEPKPGQTQEMINQAADDKHLLSAAQRARALRPAAGTGTGGTGGGLSEDDVQWWAAQHVLHGLKPNLTRNSPDWARIAAAEPTWAKLNDVDPAEARAKSDALRGAYKAVQTGAAKTSAYEGAADGAMDILSKVSVKVPRVGFAPLDSLFVKGAAMLPGDAGANAKNMSNAAHTLATEYGRVMTGLNGVTTDQANARAEAMLSDGLSNGTMAAVMQQFRQEFKARNEGNEKELKRISDAIKAMFPAKKTAEVPVGTRRQFKDGTWHVKAADGGYDPE